MEYLVGFSDEIEEAERVESVVNGYWGSEYSIYYNTADRGRVKELRK